MAERKDLVPRDEFPPNSHSSKREYSSLDATPVKKEKHVEKIVKGKVVKRKKSMGRKLSETFLEDDGQNVMDYIIYDVLIPSAKETLSNVVTNGIEMLLFGESKGSRTTRDRGKSRVSYQSYYDDENRRSRSRGRGRRTCHDFDDIIFDHRGEAEEVLSSLVELIDGYGQATVGDFYDLVGMSGSYTDNKWGWDNLASAYIERARGGGYIIRLPRTIILD